MILAFHKSTIIPIADESAIGTARRAVVALAAAIGFNESERGTVAILAAESATNIARHARTGELIVRGLGRASQVGLEILALDKGSGIRDVARASADGFSTSGTPGTGLGAIARLSSFTDMYSAAGQGTALLMQTWAGVGPSETEARGASQYGVVCVAKPGEEACGDDWSIMPRDDGRTVYVVADGLGHGIDAAEASASAIRIAGIEKHLDPVGIIERTHAALRSTRGAALAIAEVDVRAGVLRFAGIGNIAASILMPGQARNLVSHNGTVGHGNVRAAEFVYPFPAGATLIMMSDGVSAHGRAEGSPGLLARHPGVMAGILYRDLARGRDDATVLVARPGPSVLST